jgi:Epoxide hydrolase N terminus
MMKQPEDRSRRRFLKASSMLGLAVAFSPGTIVEAFADSKSKTNKEEDAMTRTSATQRGSEQGSDKTGIRPFQFNFPDAGLTDLRRRVNAARWPERELVNDASQGVQLTKMQKLARYWGQIMTGERARPN